LSVVQSLRPQVSGGHVGAVGGGHDAADHRDAEAAAELLEIKAAGYEVTDPVERLETGCRAYLGYGAHHPQRYELLFSRERPSDTAMGEAAASSAATFATLQDSISDCAAHGRSASTDPFADAVALWSGLHGYARLHTTHSRVSVAAQR
jgi:AcrR family transcriptional regulator